MGGVRPGPGRLSVDALNVEYHFWDISSAARVNTWLRTITRVQSSGLVPFFYHMNRVAEKIDWSIYKQASGCYEVGYVRRPGLAPLPSTAGLARVPGLLIFLVFVALMVRLVRSRRTLKLVLNY